MGYSTDFYGRFEVSPQLDPYLAEYLAKFASVRHMRRDVEAIKENYPDWQSECPGGVLGIQGEYFVGGGGLYGQAHDATIIDYNYAPSTQPCLWCQWVPSEDGCGIEWDGGEKFYNYTEWLEYLIYNFLEPNGYVVNGEVEWAGEDRSDIGKIVVVDNQVREIPGEVTYPEEEEDSLPAFANIKVPNRA